MMWPLLHAQGNCRIKNFVARSDPAKPSGSGLKRVRDKPCAQSALPIFGGFNSDRKPGASLMFRKACVISVRSRSRCSHWRTRPMQRPL